MRATEKKALALALGVGYGISAPAFADLVVLRSGEKLEGSVTGQTISSVNFVGDEGQVRVIPKSTIASIFYFSRQETNKQDIKLVALKKEEAKKEREEKLKKKREEDRKRREKELREKQEQERRAELDRELENRTDLTEEERRSLEEQKRRNAENQANDQERRRLEALRIEKTKGTIRLWSGQEINAQIVEKHGDRYVLETSAGFMEFHASEIEQMEIAAASDGSRPARTIGPADLEAVKTVATSEDALDLSSGATVSYRNVSFDGYNTEVDSDVGHIKLRPEDGHSMKKPSGGMDLLVGQYGYVMLRSGLQVYGDLILRSNYEWVLQTEKGEVHFNPDDIVFARTEAKKEESFSLLFWR